MNRIFTKTIFIIFYFSCIVRPPEKPDPPYQLLNYLIKGVFEEANNDGQTVPVTPSPPALGTNPRGFVTDTGQTLCWDSAGTAVVCAGTGQDGDYSNIPLARSFTGPSQDPAFNNDYITMDETHQRVWKSCAQGRAGNTCAGGITSPLTWNNAIGVGPDSCSDLNTLNAGSGYANRNDWRVPTIHELASLVHFANIPNIENANFPNTDVGSLYVSITVNAQLFTEAWTIDYLLNGGIGILPQFKLSNFYLRCVAGTGPPAPSFQDNSNGTVTDRNSNLVWQKCVNGRSGTACTTGANMPLNWQNALTTCNNLVLGGRSDWRLPNVNELLSILDYSFSAPPLVSIGFFPNTPADIHYTSTTYSATPNEAFTLDFGTGNLSSALKGNPFYVRCVTSAP